MNKILQTFKFCLFFLVVVFFIKASDKYKLFDLSCRNEVDFVSKFAVILFVIIFIINIVDIIVKKFSTKKMWYFVLVSISLVSTLLVLLRSLYDKTIITNIYAKPDAYKLDFGIRYINFSSYILVALYLLNIVFILVNLIHTRE